MEEIADLMNTRPSTVRTHLSRALAALRVALPAAEPTNGDHR